MAVAAVGRAAQASMVLGLRGRWELLDFYLTALRAFEISRQAARRHP